MTTYQRSFHSAQAACDAVEEEIRDLPDWESIVKQLRDIATQIGQQQLYKYARYLATGASLALGGWGLLLGEGAATLIGIGGSAVFSNVVQYAFGAEHYTSRIIESTEFRKIKEILADKLERMSGRDEELRTIRKNTELSQELRERAKKGENWIILIENAYNIESLINNEDSRKIKLIADGIEKFYRRE